MTVSTIVGTARKIMQFGNFVFAEAQDITLQGNLQGSKSFIKVLYFYENYFPS